MRLEEVKTSVSEFAGLLRWVLRSKNFDPYRDKYVGTVAGRVERELGASPLKAAGLQDVENKMLREEYDSEGNWIFLAPPRKLDRWLPILGFSCNLTESVESHEFRLRLALFSIQDGAFVGFGYRFEAPEGGANSVSGHGFYHAQPTTSFDGLAARIPGMPAWVPSREPTFALDARSPAQLLAGALVSLYGSKFLDDAVSGRSSFASIVEPLQAYRFRRVEKAELSKDNDGARSEQENPRSSQG